MSAAVLRAAEPSMVNAALWYAAHGWRVHPLRPREKVPLLTGWPQKATTDPAAIREWWRQWPDANVAAVTGEQFWVLDVDHPQGGASLAELEQRHGPLPEGHAHQFTGGGGWQALFSLPEGRNIRNSAGKIGVGLDVRGTGGYAVLPPSIHPSGRAYRWAEDREPWHLPICAAPDWLVDLLDPAVEPEAERPAWRPQGRDTGADRYALKALEAELCMVAAAPQSRRNDQLNASGHALFRFVAERRLPADTIARGLLAAAQHCGLPAREAMATIKSAATARGVAL